MTASQAVPLIDLRAQVEKLDREIGQAVARVLKSGRYVKGSESTAFGRALAATGGARYAVGVGNGTDALALALQATGVRPGDGVVVPANTTAATAEAVAMIGGRIVPADIDPTTLSLSVATLEKAVVPGVTAVVPVHLYGYPAPVDELTAAARRLSLLLIEDAAQGIGATLKGRPVGSFGRAGAFSFYPGTVLGAYGDAGAVVTDDHGVMARVQALGNHGVKSPAPLVGRNSRLDELQAAILSVKLTHLDAWIERRRLIENIYRDRFHGLGDLRFLDPRPDSDRAPLHVVVRTAYRDGLQAYLNARAIQAQPHFAQPLHLQESFRDLGYGPGDFPAAEAACRQVLSLPNYPEMIDGQIDQVAAAVNVFFRDGYYRTAK